MSFYVIYSEIFKMLNSSEFYTYLFNSVKVINLDIN